MENYPYQKDHEVKDRWFVYLGEEKSDPLESNEELIRVIAVTTTAQIERYEAPDKRFERPHVKFEPRPDLRFTAPCVLDLSFNPDVLTKANFMKFMNQIEKKGGFQKEN
ncbi:hypothetical protein FACS1894167_12750 [Synergistales bacterium]|nr:hypothetical protein FACS1894167_12750 [Synergistales bacterium]